MLQPTISERVTHIHLIGTPLPLDERSVTQEEMVAEMRRRLAAHPGLKPSITNRNPLGGGESGGFPISATLLGPDLDVLGDYSLQALDKAQKLPSLADPKVSLNIANPEIRVAVDRRRAADLGVRMQTVGDALRLDGGRRRRDLELPRGRGAVSGEDACAREPARRPRGDRQAHGRRRRERRAGAHRQHRAARARPRPEHAAALQPAVLGEPQRRRRARATRWTRRPTTSARSSPT